jgi:hypothetical protein
VSEHVRDEADEIARENVRDSFRLLAEDANYRTADDLERVFAARIRALIASRDATIATMEAQWHLAESGRDAWRGRALRAESILDEIRTWFYLAGKDDPSGLHLILQGGKDAVDADSIRSWMIREVAGDTEAKKEK